MHIPDGYLGPQTYGVFYGVMVPVWYWSSRVLNKAFRARNVSYLALGAAFSFVLMMFNIPIPGGSTGHAVGGALLAILLGPWAACMAVTVVMVIQALLFGDGGVTAIGANSFNMAFVMPFSAYWIYRLVGSGSRPGSARMLFAAGLAGYLSLNLAALFTAVEFGIQPLIAHRPDGTPLYGPYPLSVSVPAMMVEHLLFFGFVEGLITALVVAYMARTEPSFFGDGAALGVSKPAGAGGGARRKMWYGLGILVCLTPAGLIASGSAWGEWGSEQLRQLIGYVPEGLRRLEGLWPSLFSDYNVSGWQGPLMSALGYVLSAVVGVGLIATLGFLVGRLLPSEERHG